MMLPKRSKSISTSAPTGPAVIEGVLEKKKTIGTGKYQCSVRDGKLWYSENKGRDSVIEISQIQSVREGRAKFSFEIITNSSTHCFTADSQSTRDRWIAALREAMRMISRKGSLSSTPSCLERDDENSAMARSSITSQVSNSPALNQLKPGFGGSLPAGNTKRTAPDFPKLPRIESGGGGGTKATEVVEAQKMEATSPMPICRDVIQEERFSGNRESDGDSGVNPGSAAKYNSRESKQSSILKEDKDEVMDDGDKMDNEVITRDVRISDKVLHSDYDYNDVDKQNSVMLSDGRASAAAAEDIISMAQSSLYANSADLKKFLNEKQVGGSSGMDMVAPSTSSVLEEVDDGGFSAEETRDIDGDSSSHMPDLLTRESEFHDDPEEVFSPKEDNIGRSSVVSDMVEQKPTPAQLLRRPSRQAPTAPIDSDYQSMIQTPSVMVEVELEADFSQEPIPDLPHPHIAENWSLAFADIRSFLEKSSKDDKFVPVTSKFTEHHGGAIDSLKNFLKDIERS